MVAAVGKLSYNQLVEKIIDYKHSADSSRVSEGNTPVIIHMEVNTQFFAEAVISTIIVDCSLVNALCKGASRCPPSIWNKGFFNFLAGC